MVRWDTTTLSKREGGLGIRQLNSHNKSLLQKWLWRYNTEEHALWRRFVAKKYGALNHWITKEVHTTYGGSVWKTIRNLWPEFIKNIKVEVGNGAKASFWDDNWLEQDNLKTIYPDTYSLSVQRENLISQIWSPQGWNLLFRRPLNDWEIERFSNMLSLLQQFKGLSGNGDKLLWINNEGKFTVKSAYARWNQPARQLDMWPWKRIWKVKIPYKVSCFVWLVV